MVPLSLLWEPLSAQVTIRQSFLGTVLRSGRAQRFPNAKSSYPRTRARAKRQESRGIKRRGFWRAGFMPQATLRKRSERAADAPQPCRAPGPKDDWTLPGPPPTREAEPLTA